MNYRVIINPYASRGRAVQLWERVEQLFRQAGASCQVEFSQSATHLEELAYRAARVGDAPILIGGGDGTLGIALNGLAAGFGPEREVWGPVGVLPFGTANDLVDNTGLSPDLERAVAIILAGKTRRLDVCRVNSRYFINNAAVGAEAAIAWRQNRMTWAKGTWRYFAAALVQLVLNEQWPARLTWDDGSWEGRVSMVSLGNGCRTGGIYYTVPAADPFDGRLSFVFVEGVNHVRLISQFTRLMKLDPPYTDLPDVHQYHTTHLRIELERPSPAHADGEIFTEGETVFDCQVLPGKLALFTP